MRDGAIITIGIKIDLTDGKRPAHLDQFTDTDYVGLGRGFAQEVDIQTGGDGECHNANFSKNSGIERYICDCHHDGPRDRATGSEFIDADTMAHCGSAIASGFDNAAALREVRCHKFDDIGGCGHLC